MIRKFKGRKGALFDFYSKKAFQPKNHVFDMEKKCAKIIPFLNNSFFKTLHQKKSTDFLNSAKPF